METLTPREIELIEYVMDRTFDRMKAEKINPAVHKRWISLNQARIKYGAGRKKVKTAILKRQVKEKNPFRTNPHEPILVDERDVIRLVS